MADTFRGHQPPGRPTSPNSTEIAMHKLKIFVATLFVALAHGAAIGRLSLRCPR